MEGKLDDILAEANLSQVEDHPVQRNSDFANEDLAEAQLSETDFTGSDFHNADLEGTALTESVLTDAQLGDANLSESNLEEATLTDADLQEATLDGAALSDADLSGANLEDASLRDALLGGAELGGVNLDGADLSGADLEGANVSADALAVATLDAETRCPDGSTAAADGNGGFECPEMISSFALQTDLVVVRTQIAKEFTCDDEDAGSPQFGWSDAPAGGEGVLAFTRSGDIFWLVVVPHEPFRVLGPLDDAQTIVRDYSLPCPPKPGNGDPSVTQTFTLSLYFLPKPLPRDANDNLLDTAQQILERALEDSSGEASVTGQYTRPG